MEEAKSGSLEFDIEGRMSMSELTEGYLTTSNPAFTDVVGKRRDKPTGSTREAVPNLNSQ